MKFLQASFHRAAISFALLFCLLIAAGKLHSQVYPSVGLVAYYPFSGNSNDASGYNNHPVFNNATLTTDRFGQPNEAYRFNGIDNYMRIPNSPKLNINASQLAISVWVKVNGFSNDCRGSNILMKGDRYTDQGTYYLKLDDSHFTNGESCAQPTPGINPQNFNAKSVSPMLDPDYIKPGKWYNVIYVCNNAFATLYVNGQLVSSGPVNNKPFTSVGDLFLGRVKDAIFPGWLNGELDEIRIYDRPLHESEINALGEWDTPTAPACDFMVNIPSRGSKVTIGDADVAGNKLTVEAVFNRTGPLNSGLYYGNLVSKHSNLSDVNYSLRPDGCDITTTGSGYTTALQDCPAELGKTYHVAMVYDGSFLKFYRNGNLLGQTPCTGDLVNNDWATTIGQIANGGDPPDDQFLGYVGEVRIWKEARTQVELIANMNKMMINPAGQSLLVAGYSFSDLENKKGNGTFQGILHGDAITGKKNPDCTFGSNSCAAVEVIPGFTAPDTVCVNTPVHINNTSKNATKYRWSFCSAISTIPETVSLGEIGGALAGASDIDYAFFNGNYYAFVLNNDAAKITRLNFGTSLLNIPIATEIRNLGGALNDLSGWDNGDLQVVQNQGMWYIFIVFGSAEVAIQPRILKLDFGANLLNTSPGVINWGNIGNLDASGELFLFQENNNWYGFVTNAGNHTLTRLHFTDNFDNKPTAVNLGSFNNMLYFPRGIEVVNDNGFWRMFVINGIGNAVRLDFGNSLLSTPTVTSLLRYHGGAGPTGIRDLAVIKDCNQYLAFTLTNNTLAQLLFPALTDVPVQKLFGLPNTPCCNSSMSRLFRVGDDIYTFILNTLSSESRSLLRVKVSGCANPDFPSTSVQNPDPIIYTAPGTYKITLIVDEGLTTEASFCKEVVVLPPLQHKPTQTISICKGSSVKLGISSAVDSYKWNNGVTTDSIVVNTAGTYWVETNRFGCFNRDSFNIVVTSLPLNIGKDTSVCVFKNFVLDAGINSVSYLWNNGNTSRTVPINTPGTYYVTLTQNSCEFSDTITVDIYPKPVITVSIDTTICYNGFAKLFASGGTTYKWSPAVSLNDPNIADPVANPTGDTRYRVIITDRNGCEYLDSTDVLIREKPVFSINAPQPICSKDSAQLSASGGDVYVWQPTVGLNNAGIAEPMASPGANTDYRVTITEGVCNESVILSTKLTVLPVPDVNAVKSNDIDCSNDRSQLNATGAGQYIWKPATTLNDQGVHNPVAKPTVTTEYIVEGKDLSGCKGYDTIVVKVDGINKGGYEVPNAFTPNNDGLNDCYGIKYWGVVNELDFSIYNQWGERVFFTKTTDQCWDGTYKGVKQGTGVFIYMIRANTSCDSEVVRKGTFVLVR